MNMENKLMAARREVGGRCAELIKRIRKDKLPILIK